MAFAFGPRIAALGVLCIINALAGLQLDYVPFLVFGCVDGLLKIGFGIAMLSARPYILRQESEHDV